MQDQILATMATDLKVHRFTAESDTQYNNRVIYSAIASWIKATALDRPINTKNNASGVSRRHILDKCQPILSELLKRFPTSKQWFEISNSAETPIAFLRSRLLRHGDLLNVGFNTNLTLSREEKVSLTNEIECIKGVILKETVAYSGLATIRQGSANSEAIPKNENIKSTDWLVSYIKEADWQTINQMPTDVQFFNPFKKTNNNYSCWQNEVPELINSLLLIRRQIERGNNEYALLLKRNSNTKIHHIDPFLSNIREHYRIMFALRAYANNPIQIEALHYSDHTHLSLYAHLPQQEATLLETYTWPYKSIEDLLEWDMTKNIWAFIKPHLIALGIRIKETPNG